MSSCGTGSSTTPADKPPPWRAGSSDVDRVAYINHDIDDALRAGIIGEDDLPAEQISCSERRGRSGSILLARLAGARGGGRHRAERRGGWARCLRLRKFMSSGLSGERRRAPAGRARVALRTSFDHYLANLDEVPARTRTPVRCSA